MQEIPEGLPPWLQAILYVGGLVVAFGAAWTGWIKKAAKPSEAPNALIAGDIMATKPMKDLALEVGKLAEEVGQLGENQNRNNDRVIDAINRLHDAERSTESAIRDMCRELQRSAPVTRP